MFRCAQSPRSNVPPKYASARRFFARLASEIFLTSLQTAFFNNLLVLTGSLYYIALVSTGKPLQKEENTPGIASGGKMWKKGGY